MPEKFESTRHKLFWSDEQRTHVLLMLIESIGLTRLVKLLPEEALRAALDRGASARPVPTTPDAI